MTASELKRIRRELDLTQEQMGQVLALEGKPRTNAVYIAQMESGKKPITLVRYRLLQMIGWHGVPSKWTQTKGE